MPQMIGKIVKLVLRAAGVALSVSSLCFAVVHVIPGDMALEIAFARYGESDIRILETADRIRAEEGLTQPLYAQYCKWISRVFRFDLGFSIVDKSPVVLLLKRALKFSFILGAAATLASLCFALPMGIAGGLFPNGKFNVFVSGLSSLIVSIPSFVWGIMLIVLFALKLKWLPVAGFMTPSHLVLPAVTTAIGLYSTSVKVIAVAMEDTVASPYYAFARCKGLSEAQVLFFHGLRNASVPVLTYIGMQTAGIFGGTIAVERLFNWPGAGMLFLDSVMSRDIPVVQATGIAIGLIYVGVNTTAEWLCALLKPTIEVERPQ
jgi:peptide/nickel transport system permease protein